jgi:hypothetical protein
MTSPATKRQQSHRRRAANQQSRQHYDDSTMMMTPPLDKKPSVVKTIALTINKNLTLHNPDNLSLLPGLKWSTRSHTQPKYCFDLWDQARIEKSTKTSRLEAQ